MASLFAYLMELLFAYSPLKDYRIWHNNSPVVSNVVNVSRNLPNRFPECNCKSFRSNEGNFLLIK